jgi:hypothetical protein
VLPEVEEEVAYLPENGDHSIDSDGVEKLSQGTPAPE